MGPNDVSASPSPSTSSATTLNASSGAGHPPVSLAFVATNAVDFWPGTRKCPSIDDTLQTAKPSPMSRRPGSGEAAREGVVVVAIVWPFGTGCHAGAPKAPVTAVGSPPFAGIV